MPPAPGSIAQSDTLVGPVISQLVIVCQQIAGLGNVYSQIPDMPPEDSSVLLAPTEVVVQDDITNAKLVLTLHFEVLHLFNRASIAEALAAIFAAIPAWLNVMTAWSNQTLGGVSQNLNLTQQRIGPYTHANQSYLALIQTVTVRVVQNINTAP